MVRSWPLQTGYICCSRRNLISKFPAWPPLALPQCTLPPKREGRAKPCCRFHSTAPPSPTPPRQTRARRSMQCTPAAARERPSKFASSRCSGFPGATALPMEIVGLGYYCTAGPARPRRTRYTPPTYALSWRRKLRNIRYCKYRRCLRQLLRTVHGNLRKRWLGCQSNADTVFFTTRCPVVQICI